MQAHLCPGFGFRNPSPVLRSRFLTPLSAQLRPKQGCPEQKEAVVDGQSRVCHDQFGAPLQRLLALGALLLQEGLQLREEVLLSENVRAPGPDLSCGRGGLSLKALDDSQSRPDVLVR